MIWSAEALERGLKATLMNRAPAEAPVLVSQLCEVVPSDGESEKHEWLGDPPQMTEFQGARKATGVSATGYTITNKVYDAAIRFGRDDLRRNRSGSFQRVIDRLADVAMSFGNKRIVDVLEDGTTDLCYDGESFFGDAHLARNDEGKTHDNLLAGSGVTVANISTDVGTALSTFRLTKAENGEPFFGDLDLQVVYVIPPAVELKFAEVLGADIISSTTNVRKGLGGVISSSRLSDANDWYAFVVNPGFKPLIYQPEMNSIEVDATAEGSDMWKQERQAEFGVSLGVGAGYGFWQSAIKFVNS